MKSVRRALEVGGACLIALAVATPGLSGMVLCVGSDGHISLEVAHIGDCHDLDNSPVASVEIAPDADEACCGGCTDVSLSSDHVVPLIQKTRRVQICAPDLAWDSITSPGNDLLAIQTAGQRPPPEAGLRPSPALLAQATIVLRT